MLNLLLLNCALTLALIAVALALVSHSLRREIAAGQRQIATRIGETEVRDGLRISALESRQGEMEKQQSVLDVKLLVLEQFMQRRWKPP